MLDMLVKPQLPLEREDLVNETALKLIKRSSIICVFGMAMEATDRTWWRTIANWLGEEAEERNLIINKWDIERAVIPPHLRRSAQRIVYEFFEGASISDADLYERLEPKNIAARNSTAFNFDINYIPDKQQWS